MPDRPRMVTIPGFALGGRVDRDGLAVVHKDEFIIPAPGSEAIISPVAEAAGGPVINYYFPVEVVVMGELDDAQKRAVAEYVYDHLLTEIRSQL